MTAIVTDLQATPARDGSGASQSVGNLWIEVDRLKREGQSVRNLEWQVSELEESLRGNHEDAASRRHRLDNLAYEIEALQRRNH